MPNHNRNKASKQNQHPPAPDASNPAIKLFIKSDGLETKIKTTTDPASGKEMIRHYIEGSINGEGFQILCNEPVDVPHEIAELLLRLIEHQKP